MQLAQNGFGIVPDSFLILPSSVEINNRLNASVSPWMSSIRLVYGLLSYDESNK